MRVIIVPSILAFAYLGPLICLDSITDIDLLPPVMWMAALSSSYIGQGDIEQTVWGNRVILTCLVASMTVNALVTGLIVFRIFKVFRHCETRGGVKSDLNSITK